jgi:erythromycin esterase
MKRADTRRSGAWRALGAALLIGGAAACAGEAVPPAAPPAAAAPSAQAPPDDPEHAVVEGLVRGPDGSPVDGALVAVVPAGASADREAAAVVSEGGGRFRVAKLTPGKYAITVTAPGLTAAYVDVFTLEAGKTRGGVEAKLAGEAITLSGTVVDAGKQPIAGVTLRAVRVSDVEGDIFLARTDARGAYRVTLPKARYALTSGADGLESPPTSVRGDADQTIDLALTRVFPLDVPAPAEVAAWLAQAAIPLATPEAGHGFADMAPLRDVVGKARVVALGEATHGTREFFQLKHRMLEYLVTELGFTAFAIEANLPEAMAVNDYVLTGKGDPADAIHRMRFWTWDTEEVLALVRWMRGYNADPGHARKLHFYGFDMQSPSEAAQALVAYLHDVDPAFEPEARRVLTPLDDFTETIYAHLPAAAIDATHAGLAAIVRRIDERREAYVKRAGEARWTIARLQAKVASQAEVQLARPRDFLWRDRAMAENVQALLDLEGPTGKMVLWAHNAHVARAQSAGARSMGSYLSDALGADMVVFGFAFGEGSFQAMEMPFDTGVGLRAFTVPLGPPGSLDATLAALGKPVVAVDLRRAPRAGVVGEWLGARLSTRSFGAGYSEAQPGMWFQRQDVRTEYDALLFVSKTTAARPNPGGKRLRPPILPSAGALVNLGMEEGAAGELPAGWQGTPADVRAPYRVASTGERPREGKRCAVIARERSPWPWGVGKLWQQIEAAPFRGKRVRLRAAARAEVRGFGNEAHLAVTVKGPASPMALLGEVLAVGATFDRPIVDRAWRYYEVEADVPAKAESITVAFALAGDGKAYVDDVSFTVVTSAGGGAR